MFLLFLLFVGCGCAVVVGGDGGDIVTGAVAFVGGVLAVAGIL